MRTFIRCQDQRAAIRRIPSLNVNNKTLWTDHFGIFLRHLLQMPFIQEVILL